MDSVLSTIPLTVDFYTGEFVKYYLSLYEFFSRDSANLHEIFTFYVTQHKQQGLINPHSLYNCEIFNKK